MCHGVVASCYNPKRRGVVPCYSNMPIKIRTIWVLKYKKKIGSGCQWCFPLFPNLSLNCEICFNREAGYCLFNFRIAILLYDFWISYPSFDLHSSLDDLVGSVVLYIRADAFLTMTEIILLPTWLCLDHFAKKIWKGILIFRSTK